MSESTVIPYSVKVEVANPAQGKWKTARVRIFEAQNEKAREIGSYERNHAGWCEPTFAPFQRDGKWYALYAPDYTATRVMELPSCTDLGGEEPQSGGFCPVDYYVPYDHPDVIKAKEAGHFGFVAGCVWGDDSSWKIQYLDLSNAPSGIVVRKELFGYVEMPLKAVRLTECVSLAGYSGKYPYVGLTVAVAFNLRTGEKVDPLA